MKYSAGIMLYKRGSSGVEVLLVHPGGPFWANKDLGSWSIPKGLFEEGERPIEAATREFAEEIGSPAPRGNYIDLGETKLSSEKVLHAYALEFDFNLEKFHSNMFEMEWPPKSGKKQEFPENDRAAWVPLGVARQKLVKGQAPLVEKLAELLGERLDNSGPSASSQSSLF